MNTREYKYRKGEMLIGNGYTWKKVDDGVIPKGAIFGGLSSDGGNLFIGKALHEGSLIVGRVSVNGVLFAAHNQQEIIKKSFEILVKDAPDEKHSDSRENFYSF